MSCQRSSRYSTPDLGGESDGRQAVPQRPEPGGAASARALLDQRDALLQDPGFQAELASFFEGLRDTRPAEPVEFP